MCVPKAYSSRRFHSAVNCKPNKSSSCSNWGAKCVKFTCKEREKGTTQQEPFPLPWIQITLSDFTLFYYYIRALRTSGMLGITQNWSLSNWEVLTLLAGEYVRQRKWCVDCRDLWYFFWKIFLNFQSLNGQALLLVDRSGSFSRVFPSRWRSPGWSLVGARAGENHSCTFHSPQTSLKHSGNAWKIMTSRPLKGKESNTH